MRSNTELLLPALLGLALTASSIPAQVQPAWVERFHGVGTHSSIAKAVALGGSGNVYVTGDSGVVTYEPSTWKQAVVTGTAGSASRIRFYINSPGDVYIDDLSLVAGAVAEVGPNLISNGDFESAFPGANYVVTANYSNSAVSTSIKHSGNASLHLAGLTAGSSDANIVYQDISPPLTANQTYTLSFWYYPGTSGSNLLVRVSSSTINKSVPILPAVLDDQLGYATIKYSPGAAQLWVARFHETGFGDSSAKALAVDDSENVYVTGAFYRTDGTAIFDTLKYDSSGGQLCAAVYSNRGSTAIPV